LGPLEVSPRGIVVSTWAGACSVRFLAVMLMQPQRLSVATVADAFDLLWGETPPCDGGRKSNPGLRGRGLRKQTAAQDRLVTRSPVLTS
jgi:hypothetical protein